MILCDIYYITDTLKVFLLVNNTLRFIYSIKFDQQLTFIFYICVYIGVCKYAHISIGLLAIVFLMSYYSITIKHV